MDIEQLKEKITERIEDQTIILDESAYSNTYFHNCTLVFRGKTPPRLKDNVFSDCTYRFENEAQNTIEFLQGMASAGGDMEKFIVQIATGSTVQKGG